MGALILFPGEEFSFNSLRSSVKLEGAEGFHGETGVGGGLSSRLGVWGHLWLWHGELIPLEVLIILLWKMSMTTLTPAAQDRTVWSCAWPWCGPAEETHKTHSFNSSVYLTPCYHSDHSSHSIVLLLLVHLSCFLSW